MEIDIPPWLQWVSYLAGDTWPQGRATGMFRIDDFFHAAAEELDELIPDLNQVRGETLSVLFGETAQAADERFRTLFDGDYAVNKLSDAVRALGESAGFTGSEIEYSKLSIVVGLALAAAEISYSLSMSGPTGGASLGWIPPIEMFTMAAFRRWVVQAGGRVVGMLRSREGRAMVRREIRQEAWQELAIWGTQEGIVYKLQGDHYVPNSERLLLGAAASTVGGGAGGGTAVPVSAGLGSAGSKLGRAGKGMTTFFTAGIAGNIVGTAVTGNNPFANPLMMVTSSTTSSIGGARGAGVMPGSDGNRSPNGQLPPPEGGPPDGPPPDGPQPDDDTDDDSRSPATDPESTSTNEPSDDGEGARVSTSPTDDSAAIPQAATQSNDVAPQADPEATPAATPSADSESDTDSPTTTETPAAQPNGEAPQSDPSTEPATPTDGQGSLDSDSETSTGQPSTLSTDNGDLPAPDPETNTPVTDPAEHTTNNGQQPAEPAIADNTPSLTPQDGDQSKVEAAANIPTTSPDVDTAPAAGQVGPPPASPTATPSSVGPSATPSAQTPNAQTPDARTPSAQTPTSSQRATPKTTPPQSSTDTPATKTPKPAAQQHVPDTPTAAASANESTVSPVAGISDAAATPAQNSTDQANTQQPTKADTEQPTKAETEQPTKNDEAGPTLQHRIVIPSPRPGRSLNDCLQRVANRLSEKYGKPIRLLELPSARGTPARVLFQAVGSGSEFATYADVAEVLGGMDPGSSAILTSVWANGPRQGGHAYLAVNDSGRVYLEDPDTGERRPWPPPWGQDAVVRSAVAFLDAKGNATSPLHDTRQLVAAAAVGHVQGHPDSEVGPADPAQRWQHVPTQEDLANAALEERGLDPDEVHKLRHPLGVTEAARELGRYRAQDNAKWWNELTGEQQRALIDTYPQHIGNAEGIPADARDVANRLALEQDRKDLQARRDRGERLTGQQRKQLARYDRIQAALDRSGNDAKKFGGPLLLAFDPFAFGGDGRAVVSFGHDPYKADSVSVHVPGRGMDIDQIGPTMGDAIKQLQSTLREDPDLKASSIAWIGYDTASGWKGLRAAGRSFARTGGAILCGDIQAFNAVRATPAAIHVFGHSYGSTTTSYAAEGGRLRGEVKTITLIGSPGAGPLKKAAQAGMGAENFFVAASSRDPATALGGRTRRAWGRIFGFGLGMDPAMEDFGAQRIAAEFSAEMDTPQTNRTHNAYYRYVDKTAGVRSESLANFGRIAAGKSVDIDPRRTVDERPWYRLGWRTVEPAEGRPLRLHDDTTGEHAGDRDTRRWWNPQWRAQSGQVEPPSFSPESPAASHLHDDVDGSHHDDSDDPGQRWKHVPTQEELANAALADRGLTPEQAHRLRNPLGLMEAACERAGDNRAWWNGLTGEQQRALIATYPQHIGNAEGIPAQARDVANRLALEQDRKDLQARLDRGERLTRPQRQQLARLDRVQAALDRAAQDAKDVGGPLLLAFDPFAFGGDGRAIVSLGHDPYKADSVSVHVPGVNMTIDELGPSMGFALNHLRSTLHENPDLTASSIVWLGYDTPRGPRQVASDRSARAGANILYSDIRAFNTVRDTPAAIHIFAHSYGSVTASYAGRDGRLANDIRSVSLIGSPGAGPLNSADEFGPDVDVYVASSSRDPIAALGGRTEGSRGRIFGRGMGIDPAMQSFGAQRITAEFSAGMDSWVRNMGTHNAYYSYVNKTAGVRSESLANFGRIAAGKPVDTEQHRTIRERPLRRPHIKTVEPAKGRPLQLADDTTGEHAGDHARRRPWNPRWLSPIAPDGTPHTPDGDHPSEPHTPSSAELVKAALEARGVGPDGLVSPADHRVSQDVAVARAKANAKWWKGLSDPDSDGFSDVQWALIRAYPFQIGNAEGIPPLARHEANSIMLQRNLARRDVLVSRRDNGVELNAKQERFIDLMNDIEAALASGKRNTGRAKVGGPYLLALDPQAFDGVGRAIVSFGADPYTAKSVSWYVPGMSTTIEKLRTMMLRGFNTLQSTLRENTDPDFTAASITYLGYKPPGSWDPQVGFQKMAREGGEIFASDMLAFNAGREIITGSPFSNHHVFAHSYGSSTVSHAGYGRRLAGQVKTITLIGSPGAGPLRNARDFGIGEENVFVASSSRDRTTGLGGERPGARGRTISWMGQGIDPAMDFFGAQRITAEFPSALDQLRGGSRMTHSIYWAYMDPGLNPQVRSESLTNFGRIAAGKPVDTEQHRTLGERARLWRNPTETTIEPAIGRPLRIADDPHTHHPVNRRHYWNPRFLRDIDCGHGVIQELSAIYEDKDVDFVLDVPPSPRGVPARNLFNAIRSRSEFATYAQIERRLKKLGHGSTALLASRWRGRGQGGHAYLATNVHGKIRAFDPHDGEWSDWPPPWSEKSIRRTAVGYLKANGEPVDQYDGSTRDLAAASFIGRVQGRPDPDAVADALARRMPRVGVAELVSPLGWAELAAARAEMNATWWSGLSPEQRQELVKAHPYEIGNAEGIFPEHRNDANQRVLQGYRGRAAEYKARQENGERLQDAERKFLDRVNRIDAALQEATAAAELVGLDPPLLLGFDPRDFGGNGRALISFGTDPSQAEMVSWHATRQSIEQLGTGLAPVLDQLVSTREETPTAAAIIWVGKEASKVRVPWDTSRKPGPDGVLNSDQAAFRGARAVWARTGTSELATVGDATESQVAVEEAPLTDTELTPVKPAYVHELSETEARALRIEEALAQRNPRVRPDELRNPVDMVDSNPADMADEASARARNNAAWWKGLTPDQRQDLIEAYPEHIGNAEGIPPKDRDAANQIVLEQLRDRRDRVLDKIHHFKPPSLEELRLLRRVNRLDRELRKASADAKRANVDGPLLLAFDPAEFGGDGRAVLSFGHDPYDADSVSVHVPGVGTTVRSRFFFGFYNSCALNHLLSTWQENPNLKAASIAWIGYDTPSGRKLGRMRNQDMARAGGELLYSDIRALSEGRARWNGSDARAPSVHVFGYSYGSTTTAHAGVGGRLADYVSTVSLVGSPGAGPLQQASEFGLDDGNVFVASSSRDLVTGLGGRTEGSTSRILPAIARKLGLGLGIDPAMESFGAVRVTAEVPVAMNRPHILGTHDTYYQYANPDGDPRVRSEALANLGRIAADRTDRLHLERHRTEGDRRGLLRTVDPAGERSVHRFGNPAWLGADGRRDPEFLQRQADYRAQDRTTRRVDSRYAQPLGDVVDNAGDMESARRLAEDLSGVYGPFRIRLQAERFGTEVRLTGVILNGDTEIGNIQRVLDRGSDGKLVAYHTGVSIKEEFAHLRGHGFSKALTAELERYYVQSGVDRIEVWTHDKGANIWARRGFTWNPDPQKLQESLDKIKRAAETLSAHVSADARRALDEMVQRLEPDHPRLPEPIEIAHLATADEPNLGRRLLESVGLRPDGGVHLVRYLAVETEVLTSQRRKGFRALLQRWFGLGADRGSLGGPDCGRGVVAAWARRYGRDVRVPIPRSRTGLPAWAVFEATGSGSRFATDDEVFAELQRLGPGSSAILASRWSGGRWGGHARFAVNDGGRIYVEECYNERTSERLGWPPQGAVSQTAVGYFDSYGNPTHPLHDVPLQLAAADAIGDVKGLPEEPDFVRRQQEYRAQDPITRQVDTRYAEPLGEVMANASSDPARADQLAADLSGVYGPCRIEMTQEHFDPGDIAEQLDAIAEGIPTFGPSIYGDVVMGDQTVGTIHWNLNRDKVGVLVAEHRLHVDQDFPVKEFTDAVTAALEPYFQRSGVARIESTASGKAAYAAAARGESWNPDPRLLQQSLDEVKRSAAELLAQVSDSEARDKLVLIMWRSDPNQPDIPEPIELAYLSTRAEPDLGRRLLEGTGIVDPSWDVRPETQLHTVNDLQGNRPTPPTGEAQHRQDDADVPSPQQQYRDQGPTTRRVDPSHAEPLGDVVDSVSSAGAGQLAKDLSGVYGPYAVQFDGYKTSEGQVVLDGEILSGERQVGLFAWRYYRDGEGSLVAHLDRHVFDGNFRGGEFATPLIWDLVPYFVRSGVDRITSTSSGHDVYSAADLGDTWDPDPQRLQESLDNIKRAAQKLAPLLSTDAQALLGDIVQRLDPAHPRLPEPIDLAKLATPGVPNLGRRLLDGTGLMRGGGLHYVKYLWSARLLPGQNCGHRAIERLSERYRRFGREFHIEGEPSRRGVPARTLFEAIGSRADSMTYSEVEELLMQMDPGKPGEPGPAALLVSSWAGGPSRGGHAYLAVLDGGRVYLEDPFTGERSPWPPYWGEGAVSHTAVGFLSSTGRAVEPLASPWDLVAADMVGDVQGLPKEPGVRGDQARVSGSIVVNTPSTVAGITGPVQRSVTGLVTGLAPESRTTPTATVDDSGTPWLTASIVLHAVEVRGPTHVQLSEALGDPGLLRIDSDDLTVRCRVQYRIFDSGNIQATIIYADPDLYHPNFDTVRRMIDAALQDRFPDKRIEIGEAFDYGDRTDFVDRELPPRDALEEYRGLDPASREAKAAYADSLGDVLGRSVSLARVRQLADDLSGAYGPYTVHLRTVDDDGMIRIDGIPLNGAELIAETHPDVARDRDGNLIAFLLNGSIMKDGRVVGELHRTFYRDTEGNLVVYEDLLTLKKEFRRQGFSKAVISELLPYYQRSGVDRVALLAWSEDGGLVWALRGLSWDLNPGRLRESLESVKKSARELSKRVGPEARAVLDEYVQRLNPDHARFPEPSELANLTAPGALDLGHQLMRGTRWHAVMYLRDQPAGGE